MDQLGRYVADAVLGIDTLWGGDVMCPSGTGRFIADSWFSDEPLPARLHHSGAARVRETGGVGGKNIDREAVEEYLREVDLPESHGRHVRRGGKNRRAARPLSRRPRHLPQDHVGSGDGDARQGRARALRALRPGFDRQAAGAVAARGQARASCGVAGPRRLLHVQQRRPAGRGGCLASRADRPDGVGPGAGRGGDRVLRQSERSEPAASFCRRNWRACRAPTSTFCPSRTPGSPAP